LYTTTFAYLKLDTPCTQGVAEFLDIFYRIQFTNIGGGQGFLNNDARYDFGDFLFSRVTGTLSPTDPYISPFQLPFRHSYLYVSPCKPPAVTYEGLYALSGLSLYRYLTNSAGSSPLTGWLSGTRVDSHYKWK
jgi:hypothetical protein